jgi:hypothetical protein
MGVGSKSQDIELYGVQYRKYSSLNNIITTRILSYCETFARASRDSFKKYGRGFFLFEFESIEPAYEFSNRLINKSDVFPNYISGRIIDVTQNPELFKFVNEYDPENSAVVHFMIKLLPDETAGRYAEFPLLLKYN